MRRPTKWNLLWERSRQHINLYHHIWTDEMQQSVLSELSKIISWHVKLHATQIILLQNGIPFVFNVNSHKSLWSLQVNPNLSSYLYIFGNFNFNRIPLAPMGTKIMVQLKASKQARYACEYVCVSCCWRKQRARGRAAAARAEDRRKRENRGAKQSNAKQSAPGEAVFCVCACGWALTPRPPPPRLGGQPRGPRGYRSAGCRRNPS